MSDAVVRSFPTASLAYGIQLPVQALTIADRDAVGERRDVGVDDMVRVAQACDAAGLLLRRGVPPRRDPARAGGDDVDARGSTRSRRSRTSRRRRRSTRLMTNVYVAAYRHPLETAKAFATLDALSGGRADPRRRRRARRRRVRRARRARSPSAARSPTRRSTRSSRRGRRVARRTTAPRWKFDDVGQRPRPVQQPRPPIWIGGSGKPALRRVAARGDGWIPQGTPRDSSARRHRVHPAAPRRGAARARSRGRLHHRVRLRRRRRLGRSPSTR